MYIINFSRITLNTNTLILACTLLFLLLLLFTTNWGYSYPSSITIAWNITNLKRKQRPMSTNSPTRYSQPKGGGETMHSLARKLTVTIPTSKTPAKPVLTHAIVVAKLRHLDTSARLSYEWGTNHGAVFWRGWYLNSAGVNMYHPNPPATQTRPAWPIESLPRPGGVSVDTVS